MVLMMKIEFDEEGYLKNLTDWSPKVAETLADQEGLDLTPAHWELIELIREFSIVTETEEDWSVAFLVVGHTTVVPIESATIGIRREQDIIGGFCFGGFVFSH